MYETAPAKSSNYSVQRRTLLKFLPAAVAGSALPRTASAASSEPVGVSEIQASLLSLWDGPQRQSSAFIRPSSIDAVNGMIAGCYAAFVSLWRAGCPAPDNLEQQHQSFYEESKRFGRINVEVTFRRTTGFFQYQCLVEHCYLLLGRDEFDSGNMIGFLRQTCPQFGQRFVIYKPYNDRSGYLIGTSDGFVPKKKQSVCIGDFKAERFPDFFELLREDGSPIEVEKIRFPYRRCYIREELEY